MGSSLDYAGFAQFCKRSVIICKIMRAHNRIVPRSLVQADNNCSLHIIPFPYSSFSVINSQSKIAKLQTSYLTVRGWLMSCQISGGVCVTVPPRLLRLAVFVSEQAFHLARPKSQICHKKHPNYTVFLLENGAVHPV